jgi:hypothetical protein
MDKEHSKLVQSLLVSRVAKEPDPLGLIPEACATPSCPAKPAIGSGQLASSPNPDFLQMLSA